MPSTFKLPVLGEQEFSRLQTLMSSASGIHLASNKRSLVAGRLMKRLRHYHLDNYRDYLHLIEQLQPDTVLRLDQGRIAETGDVELARRIARTGFARQPATAEA